MHCFQSADKKDATWTITFDRVHKTCLGFQSTMDKGIYFLNTEPEDKLIVGEKEATPPAPPAFLFKVYRVISDIPLTPINP